MRLNQFGAVHFIFAEQAGNHVVNGTDGYKAHPAQCTGVNVCNSPVSIVAQSVNRFDRHHRAFKRRHTVEGQRYDQEFQNRVGTQFVPCTRQSHDTVDHTAPRRCEQDQRQYHTQRLSPVRQCSVVQVVRTSPHISENQSPEVDNGQAVRVNRTACLFRYEIVHHTQEAGCQEKAHRIVAVPPLNHRINRTCVNRIRFHQTGRDADIVDDVQQRNGQDKAAVEPVGNVNMFDFTFGNRTEEYDGVGNPHQRNQNVDRPFQLSVFFTLGVTHR